MFVKTMKILNKLKNKMKVFFFKKWAVEISKYSSYCSRKTKTKHNMKRYLKQSEDLEFRSFVNRKTDIIGGY